MTTNKQRTYFNTKQLESMAIAAKNEYIVASRGFGKSEGIDAPRLIRNVFAMPKSAGALLSPTYGKLLRNTLPAIFHALERLGYKRNIHYFVGRKPPLNLNFDKPYIQPFSYDYVICWFNGSIQHLISFDRAMSANSMSLDYVFGFESKYLNYDKITNEVLPANRGNLNYFSHCPWHHGMLFTTDMPTTKAGRWILDKEKECDPMLIELIKQTYREYKRTKNIKKRKLLFSQLKEYRSKATFYAEYDAFDNIELLGESFIADMERNLPPYIFASSILNFKHTKVANGFYSAFSQELHCYTSYNNPHLEALDYDLDQAAKNSWVKDGDLSPENPLGIALDYNVAICNLVVGQLTNANEMRTVNQLFVKSPRKIKDLVNDFADYYATFPNRDVLYFYDSTAVANTPADADSFANEVIDTLEKRGFSVIPIHTGQPVKFPMRHFYLDLAFKGDPNYLFPTINSDNCEYLIMALEATGTKIGPKGFVKDKTAEKHPDSPESPDELKTHVTDAWDTLYIGFNFHAKDHSPHTHATHYG